MDFETAYRNFVASHVARRSGAAATRIVDGLGYAETLFLKAVWWPMYHHFDGLHPEYQVRDYNKGWRFIDFAYLRGYFRLAMELDGFGPHSRDITRYNFTDACRRQNTLVLEGWQVLRFSFDDVRDNPELCALTIQKHIGSWADADAGWGEASIVEREVVRVTWRTPDPITPQKVADTLHISTASARRYMHHLVEIRWLEPVGGGESRIRTYRIHPSRVRTML